MRHVAGQPEDVHLSKPRRPRWPALGALNLCPSAVSSGPQPTTAPLRPPGTARPQAGPRITAYAVPADQMQGALGLHICQLLMLAQVLLLARSRPSRTSFSNVCICARVCPFFVEGWKSS